MNIHASAPRNFGRRKLFDRVMRSLLVITVLLAIIPLLFIIGYVIVRGSDALNVAFFTQTYKIPLRSGETEEALSDLLMADEEDITEEDMFRTAPASDFEARGGVLHGIVGTLMIAGTGLLISIPIGILAGVFLSEYRDNQVAIVVRFATDVLSGAPSIIVGVVAYLLLVLPFRSFSGIAGSVALSFLMVPIVARTTEEVLKLVPQDIRDAALALGAPYWYTVLVVVIPAALPGIITGVMLAFARGAGETAPLLLTASGSKDLLFDMLEPIAALPLIAFEYSESHFPSENTQAWGTAFILTMLVLIINIIVRVLSYKRS